MSWSQRLSAVQERVRAIPPGVRKGLHYAFLGGVFIVLVWRTYHLGWASVLTSLPTNPLFYIIFAGIYLSLPMAEFVIYRSQLALPGFLILKLLLIKRVLNKEVFGYAGDVYYSVSSARALDVELKETGKIVKDVAIVSAISSTTWTLSFFCLYFVLYSFVTESREIMWAAQAAAAALSIAIIGTGAWLSKRNARIYHILPSDRAKVYFVMYGRLLVITVLQILQWAVAIPEISLTHWMLYAASQLLVSRIPLIPGKDLLFAFIGIEMGTALNLPAEAIAGMLLVNSALDRLLNASSYAAFSHRLHRS